MNYQTITFFQNLAHWWDSSLTGRLVLWLVLVYGLVSVAICLVELLQDVFRLPLSPEDLPSLMALWFTLLIVLASGMIGQHILENLPREGSAASPTRPHPLRPPAERTCFPRKSDAAG